MVRYIGLIDGDPGAYGIVFPDLPGCTAMADTVEEVMSAGSEALCDWAETLEAGGRPMPAARPLGEIRTDPDVVAALKEGASLAAVPLVRTIGRPEKANLSIDSGILAAIDAEAKRRKITRSAFIEAMAREMLPRMAG